MEMECNQLHDFELFKFNSIKLYHETGPLCSENKMKKSMTKGLALGNAVKEFIRVWSFVFFRPGYES